MSVFIVDNEVATSVNELGEVIDGVQGNNEVSSALKSCLSEEVAYQKTEIKNKDELIVQVIAASSPEYLKKLTDKEFESTFNLIIYLLIQLLGDIESVLNYGDQLLTNLIETSPKQQLSLRDRKSIKATSILSELNLMFNLLPKESSSRIKIITVLLQFCQDLKFDFKLIDHSIGDNLVNWLIGAKASDEVIRQLFWQFIQLDDNYSKTSLEFIHGFTQQFPINLPELHKLIHFALSSEIIDLSFLINSNISSCLIENQNDNLCNFFLKYLSGELIIDVPTEFQSSGSTLSSSIKFKSEILSLCKLFEKSENKHVFKFSEIPFDNDKLEILIINAIKNGLIEGKLNQLDEVFILTRNDKFLLPYDNSSIERNLNNVKTNLTEWKNSLVNINDIVNNFRENVN